MRSNTDDNTALIITLASNDTSEANVPTTITVPAGQATTTFVVAGVNDSIGDGTQPVVVTASAAGLVSASAALDVTDDEGGLVLFLSGDLLSECGGTVLGTVSRTGADTAQPLVVNVVSSDTTAATVMIPVGQTIAAFTITGVDDAQSDGVHRATITISASDFQSAAKTILVADDERQYQNPRNALDVNDDQFVSPKDAFFIWRRRHRTRRLGSGRRGCGRCALVGTDLDDPLASASDSREPKQLVVCHAARDGAVRAKSSAPLAFSNACASPTALRQAAAGSPSRQKPPVLPPAR